ncbi:3'-5' exonuclease [Caryophanon latum]|uniref:Exonuclease domain-containing protein n=1 Tax=Caryophanon latum TaxID=33977 RepID=A0A1C0YUB3_9BACL|nr:3'-5' exonuclease [Caryophanon latum]OCS90757.1 hypothetical protein A6K76_01520 [Caryophanon latum]
MRHTYIFVDLEATSLRGRHHIIEIGAVKLYPDGRTEKFTQLVKPYYFKKLSYGIEALTGITSEDVHDAPLILHGLQRFFAWCGRDYHLVTYGNLDRKMLEEECEDNNIDPACIYPLVDYQQKYMIAHNLKEQPSLAKLMEAHDLQASMAHRALADADSLRQIFVASNGEQLIDGQRARSFIGIFSVYTKREQDFYAEVTFVEGHIANDGVELQTIKTVKKSLSFHVKEIERTKKDGEKYIENVYTVQQDEEMRQFLTMIAAKMNGAVVITRMNLRNFMRLCRLHNVVTCKAETMSVGQLYSVEPADLWYSLEDETEQAHHARLEQLLQEAGHAITREFYRRGVLDETCIFE